MLKCVVSYREPTLPVIVAGATDPCQWPHLNMKIELRAGPAGNLAGRGLGGKGGRGRPGGAGAGVLLIL